jgi:hypothetical protein
MQKRGVGLIVEVAVEEDDTEICKQEKEDAG